MNSKLNLLLVFFPIMIVGSLINELWVQSNALFTIILTFGMIFPPQMAMWLYRKWGGDKQNYAVYTAVVIIINVLLVAVIDYLIP